METGTMTDPWSIPGNMDLRMFSMSLMGWFCGIYLKQWIMLYQFVRVALYKYQDWWYTPEFITGVSRFNCHGWLPVYFAYTTNPQERQRPWPSNGFPWAEIAHMSPCYLLPETKYTLCGPGWDLCWTSLDSLMYIFFLLLLICIFHCNKL